MYYPPPPTPGSCPRSPQGRCRLSPPAQDLGARLWPSTLVPPTDARRTPWAVTTELSPDVDKVSGATHGALNCEAARRAPPPPPALSFILDYLSPGCLTPVSHCRECILRSHKLHHHIHDTVVSRGEITGEFYLILSFTTHAVKCHSRAQKVPEVTVPCIREGPLRGLLRAHSPVGSWPHMA